MSTHVPIITVISCLLAGPALAQAPPATAVPQTPASAAAAEMRTDPHSAVTATADGEQSPAATGEAQPPAQAKEQKTGNGWNVWEAGPFTTMMVLTLGADIGGFIQDDESLKQVGHQPTIVKWRAERINVGGTIHFKTPWVWQVGGNYNGLEAEQSNRWTWMDVRLDIPVPKLGRIRIGRQKVGVQHEWAMPLVDWIFMERASSSAFLPQRNVGVIVTNSHLRDRVLWSAGWFNDWFAQNNSFSANGNQYSARLSVLPVDAGPTGDTVVQVGGGVFYREPTNGQMQFRARPEINQADYFIDTGKFAANHSVMSEFEANVIKGRAQAFTEWAMNSVSAPDAHDPLFFGGFVGFSYFLTNEHRNFNRREGYVSRLTPRTPVGRGGIGAWEVGVRYSYTDLTSGTIDGGLMSRYTAAVNWFATHEWQMRFNYGYITLDRAGTRGHSHGFSARIVWNM